jgi:hypothetical protein
MRFPLIGVTGRAAAGKDTVSDYITNICATQGKVCFKIACADELKALCHSVFSGSLSVPRQAFYGTQAQKEAPLENVPGWTGRRILQFVGTECFRHIHSDIWAIKAVDRATSLIHGGHARLVVISDVRFLSEEAAIKNVGGIIVRVKRPEADSVISEHASETELAHIKEDYVIDNGGRELYLLENLVKDFLCQLRF